MSLPRALQLISMLSYINGGSGNTDGTPEDTAYILEDESGAIMYGVLVDNKTEFDATANDIRLGKTAVTETGVTTGEKVIPAYHTTEGTQLIMPGAPFAIQMFDKPKSEYTKLQALLCRYNGNLSNSVATTMVSINSKMYNVDSVEPLSVVESDIDNGVINLGVSNESESLFVIRYFTYKEEL